MFCSLQVFKHIKEKGSISNADLDTALGPVAKIGTSAQEFCFRKDSHMGGPPKIGVGPPNHPI